MVSNEERINSFDILLTYSETLGIQNLILNPFAISEICIPVHLVLATIANMDSPPLTCLLGSIINICIRFK